MLLGVATGSLTALVALGIVLVYRTSGVLNFSAGALGGIAAYVCYDLRDDGMPTRGRRRRSASSSASLLGLAHLRA